MIVTGKEILKSKELQKILLDKKVLRITWEDGSITTSNQYREYDICLDCDKILSVGCGLNNSPITESIILDVIINTD